MRWFLSIFFITLLQTSVFSQDTTKIDQIDSAQNKIVQYTPYYAQPLKISGNYVVVVDDPNLFLPSSGISVFNVLRGQVPGIVLSSYAPNATAKLRSDPFGNFSETSILVDGIPMNCQALDYYNFNASGFSTITALNNTNALPFLDIGGGGAIILTSKSGKDVFKPSLEAGVFYTQGMHEVSSRSGGSVEEKDKYKVYSLAYARDFGRLDLRIDYNHLNRNFLDNPHTPRKNYLSVNAGMDITDKLNARIIFTDIYRSFKGGGVIYNSFPPYLPDEKYEFGGRHNYFTGNAIVTYKFNDWLKLSGQLYQLMAYKDSISYFPQTRLTRNDQNTQQGINLLVEARWNIANFLVSDLQLAGNFTKQEAKSAGTQQNSINYFSLGRELSRESPGLSAVAGLLVKDFWNISLAYRKSSVSNSLFPDRQKHTGYAIGTAFIISELVKPDFLSLIKLRGNTGRSPEKHLPGYPLIGNTNLRGPEYYTQKNNEVHDNEMGLDISFAGVKLDASINFFKRSIDYVHDPNVFNDFETMNHKGFETDVRSTWLKRKSFEVKAGWIFSIAQFQFVVDGEKSDYTKANRRQSFNAQVQWKALMLYALVEKGNVYSRLPMYETKYTKLRDISLRWQIEKKVWPKLWIDKLVIFVSARNFYMKTSNEYDYESFDNIGFQKSVSAGLTVTL